MIPQFVQQPTALAVTLTEQTTTQGRSYTIGGAQTYASVTTMLGATADKSGLVRWRARVGEQAANAISARASGEGTRLHEAMAAIMTNQWSVLRQASLLPNIKSLVQQMVPVLQSHVSTVYGSELALYSDVLELAGRTDLLCSWDEQYTIVDFKRSNKQKTAAMIEDYFLQATAYALMAEERLGKDVPNIAIVMAVADGSGPMLWHTPKHKYIYPLHNRVAAYKRLLCEI